MVMERQLKPVIVFSFSRQNCEALALDMSKLDFNTRELPPPPPSADNFTIHIILPI